MMSPAAFGACRERAVQAHWAARSFFGVLSDNAAVRRSGRLCVGIRAVMLTL